MPQTLTGYDKGLKNVYGKEVKSVAKGRKRLGGKMKMSGRKRAGGKKRK